MKDGKKMDALSFPLVVLASLPFLFLLCLFTFRYPAGVDEDVDSRSWRVCALSQHWLHTKHRQGRSKSVKVSPVDKDKDKEHEDGCWWKV